MSDESADTPRQSQIRDIVSKYVEQCTRGESPDVQQVESQHPDLMPELAEELRKLRLVALARRDFERVFEDGSQPTHDYGDESVETATIAIRCPHCSNTVEILVDLPWTDITCVACGNVFSLADDKRATRDAPSLKKIGHFELIERIGVGGFGTVWKARDTILDRVVALKLPRRGQLTEEEIDKFLREARAAAQLRHPNIVSVHEVGRCDDTVYIVSDLVRGISLTDWMSIRSPLPRDAAQICHDIAQALDHAHQAGIVHRDLKPGNIMVDASDEPHIMDFGLAKREAGEVTMTIEGQVLGTPAYMAPEQARGQSHLCSPRTDVYSLGVILFELLTGELPFRGNTNMLLHQVLNDEPPSPRKLNNLVPVDLETICLKCLEKDPMRRFASAGALADELARVLEQRPIQSRPIGTLERAIRWCLRHQTTSGLITAVLVTLIVGTSVSTYFAMLAAGFRGEAEKSQRTIQQQTRTFTTETSSFFALGSAHMRSPFNRQLQTAAPLWVQRPDASLALMEDEVRCPETIRDFTWKFFHRSARKPDQLVQLVNRRPIAMSYSADSQRFAVLDALGQWHQFQRSQYGRWQSTLVRPIPLNGAKTACLRPSDLAVVTQDGAQLVAIDPMSGQKTTISQSDALSRMLITAMAWNHDQSLLVCWIQSADQAPAQQLALLNLASSTWEFQSPAAETEPQVLREVTRIQFGHDATREVWIGDEQSPWMVWNPQVKKWRPPSDTPSLAAWTLPASPDGEIAEMARGEVRWKTPRASVLAVPLPTWQGQAVSMVQSPDRLSLAVVTQMGALTFWSNYTPDSLSWKVTEGVRQIAFAHAVPRLAIATASEIRLIDQETGQDTTSPVILDREVEEMAWSNNDEGLAFLYSDGSAWYVNASTTQQIQEIGGGHEYTSLLFRGTENLMLGTREGELVQWKAMASPEATPVGQFSGPILAMAICHDKKALFVAHGHEVDILRDGKPTIKLPAHTGDVTHLSVSNLGDCVLCCTREGNVTRWRINWTNGQYRPHEMDTRSTAMTTAEISPDGETIATISGSRIVLWDSRSCEFRGSIDTGSPLAFARFPSLPKLATNQLFTCDQSGRLKAWRGHSIVQRPTAYTGGVVRDWSAISNPPLLVGAGDGPSILCMSNDRREHSQRIWHGEAATCLAAAQGDVARIAVGFWNGDLVVFEQQGSESNWQEYCRWRIPAGCRRLSMSRDANLLAALMSDGSLAAWNLATRQSIAQTPSTSRMNTCVAWSADQRHVVAGTTDGELLRFSLASMPGTPQDATRLAAHQGPVLDVEPMSDGSWASIGADDRLLVLDREFKAVLAEAKQPGITCLAAHPTEPELAVGSETNIHRWTVKNSKLRRMGQPWSEHDGFVTALAYSSDGQSLVSSSEDRSTIFWDTRSGPSASSSSSSKSLGAVSPKNDVVPPANASDAKAPDGKPSTDVIPPEVRALFEGQKKKQAP